MSKKLMPRSKASFTAATPSASSMSCSTGRSTQPRSRCSEKLVGPAAAVGRAVGAPQGNAHCGFYNWNQACIGCLCIS